MVSTMACCSISSISAIHTSYGTLTFMTSDSHVRGMVVSPQCFAIVPRPMLMVKQTTMPMVCMIVFVIVRSSMSMPSMMMCMANIVCFLRSGLELYKFRDM